MLNNFLAQAAFDKDASQLKVRRYHVCVERVGGCVTRQRGGREKMSIREGGTGGERRRNGFVGLGVWGVGGLKTRLSKKVWHYPTLSCSPLTLLCQALADKAMADAGDMAHQLGKAKEDHDSLKAMHDVLEDQKRLAQVTQSQPPVKPALLPACMYTHPVAACLTCVADKRRLRCKYLCILDDLAANRAELKIAAICSANISCHLPCHCFCRTS